MESNHKRSGFIKGKLAVPFYKTGKSVSTAPYLSKGMPNQSSLSRVANVGYTVHQDQLAFHQQKHNLSFVIPDKGVESLVHYDKLFGTTGDEAVDMKATKYISSVQERFKLEQVNLGRIACEDVA